jgi:hypothetical protein
MVDNKIYLEHLQIGQYEMQESGKYNIDGLFVRIEEAISRLVLLLWYCRYHHC